MRRILINCLLLASLALALPNGRNKRDFSYLRNLAQKILYGNNEINIELTPSSEEAKDTNKFRLYEVPGYDILIKVPVDDEGQYNGEVPVNLNAFGATVGTNTHGNTFHALRNVNNLVSSGILNDNHDQMLKGSFAPIFPNNYEANESHEQDIDLATVGEPDYTEENRSYEEVNDLTRPGTIIRPYSEEQSEETPMVFTNQNEPVVNVPEAIEPHSDLPNCDQVRVDTGVMLRPEQYQVVPVPEPYPVPSPAFVNVFYPNPADQNTKDPKTTGHYHHKHHIPHHRPSHHRHHHHRPHHHGHNKTIENSADNGTTADDKRNGSITEDPINYRVQFVSRVSNTETFQGINTGQTLNNTAVNNATNPIGANYGSNQFVYRNQDNLKMVTYEDKLKTNNGSINKSPVTNLKDKVSEDVKQNTSSNVTDDQNNNNSTASEKAGNENGREFTPERSGNNHVHHQSRHPSYRGHHHHRHQHPHHQHHGHHHALNHHLLPFQIPPVSNSNQNPSEWLEHSNEKNEAPENKTPEEVPLQRFEDNLKPVENGTDSSVTSTTENTITGHEDTADLNKQTQTRRPMSTDEDPQDPNASFSERLKNIHLHHRTGHPSRRHPHHHRRGHHIHFNKPTSNNGLLANLFDHYPELKQMMNENTLHTNTPNVAEETTTETYDKFKNSEWNTNAKTNDNIEDQNSPSKEENRSDTGDSGSKNRGDVPDE
ncbi:GATA zinc finger domain-containing protein 14-like [Trichoplusia ni]|uniref:GATA zinc finger domain-containing protein 14-like n=1 Tax=Trichoplusia ni TaxID=7111 RepID=A0A7E5W295_TRINI|nr:GATA zinc finger domain-containing protein 14-like [Trichoplusia ni]